MKNPFQKKIPEERLMLPPTARLEILQKELMIENQRAWNCLQQAQSLGIFTLEIPYPEQAEDIEIHLNKDARRIVISYKLRKNGA